jgi:isoleucyl-tRNA synthetase
MADWKDTLNLPRTGFPMKANLPTSEPETLARGRDGPVRADSGRPAGAPSSCCTTGRRTPTANPSRHRAQQDPEGLRRQVATMAGFDTPYVPGYDCHGLPIELKVDRELGTEEARHEHGGLPPRLPRVRRTVHRAS